MAGVRLPQGHRAGGLLLWRSDHPVADPVGVAERLAAEFPRTGLWPVLWPAWDQPTGYMDGSYGLARIGHVNITRLLASRWARLTEGLPELAGFPGVARGVTRDAVESPFAIVARQLPAFEADDPGPYLLLLVPCRQPADVIDTVGFGVPGIVPGGVGTLRRSWERRFGAYLVLLSPNGRSVFAVQSRPDNGDQATKLATEILAATAAQSNLPRALNLMSAGVLGARLGLSDPRTDPPFTTAPGLWGFALGDL